MAIFKLLSCELSHMHWDTVIVCFLTESYRSTKMLTIEMISYDCHDVIVLTLSCFIDLTLIKILSIKIL